MTFLRTLLIICLLSTLFAGCSRDSERNVVEQDDNTNTNTDSDRNDNIINPGNGNNNNNNEPLAGSCEATGVSDGGQMIDYYRFPIKAAGTHMSSSPSWTSKDFTKDFFKTDTRLRVRLVGLSAPEADREVGGQIVPGECNFRLDYNRLKFKLGVKSSPTGDYEQVIPFTDLQVSDDYSTCSNIKDFNVAQLNSITGPYILEIFDVQWDRCDNGLAASRDNPACDYNSVFTTVCFALELQVVTDFTKNFQ